MATSEASRSTQIARGVLVVAAVSLFLALLFCGQFLPGTAGETFGFMAGVMTTPFILETGLCIIGFCVVILLNHWSRKREGDEFRAIDLEDEPESSLSGTEKREQLRGDLANGHYDAAFRVLQEMNDQERALPEVLEMRIELAKATGLNDLATRLQSMLAHGLSAHPS